MASDPFALIRRDAGMASESFSNALLHPVHAVSDGVYREEPQKTAAVHPVHAVHAQKGVDDERASQGGAAWQVVSWVRERDYTLVPPQWRRGLHQLNGTPCPKWLEAERWATFVADAFKFAAGWGYEAIEAGWSIASLFGVSADPSLICLVADIDGGSVANLWRDDAGTLVASIRAGGGYRLHRRQTPDDSPMLWEINPRVLTDERS